MSDDVEGENVGELTGTLTENQGTRHGQPPMSHGIPSIFAKFTWTTARTQKDDPRSCSTASYFRW